jgi:predicted Zn finger-like uncharacterized protein
LIARCPQCQTRYRIAREKIGSQGARIRCSGCQTIFRVQAPPEEPTPAGNPTPAPAAVLPPLARALVAETDAALAKGIAELLVARRIAADVVESGSQALLRIYRHRPDLVVLGGHLPGIGAPAIAELLRRTAELRDLPTIRVAPPDEPAGAPEFEAGATLEPGDVPGGLGPILDRLGIGQPAVRPAAPAPPARTAPAPPVRIAPAPPARIAPAPPRPAPAPGSPPAATPAPAAMPGRARSATSADPEVAKAERLARITVSDIILYNERKFAAAAGTGKVAEALASELAEARQHFDSRVPAEVRSARDFLVEELQRRASLHRG